MSGSDDMTEQTTSDAEKPLPCPFCGADAAVYQYEEGGWAMECSVDGCRMMGFGPFSTESEAISIWNTRAAPSPPPSGEKKPDAWIFELARAKDIVQGYCDWGRPQISQSKPCVPEGLIRNLRPLYVHNQPPSERTRCSVGFAHMPHDFCDGNPNAVFGQPGDEGDDPRIAVIRQQATSWSMHFNSNEVRVLLAALDAAKKARDECERQFQKQVEITGKDIDTIDSLRQQLDAAAEQERGWRHMEQVRLRQIKELEGFRPYLDLFQRLDKIFGCNHAEHGPDDAERLLSHVKELKDERDAANARIKELEASNDEALKDWVTRYGEVSTALHEMALFALDLTLSTLTTERVPEDIRKRAFAAHRVILKYREKYTLRSRGEVDKGQRDFAIDNPNCNAFGENLI